MTFKKTVEDHPIWFALGLLVAGGTSGAGLSEYLRVSPKAERIAELERQSAEGKETTSAKSACDRELAMASAEKSTMKAELRRYEADLQQWKASHESWRQSSLQLQGRLNEALANASVHSQIKEIERRKDIAESSVRSDLSNGSTYAKERAAETRRQIDEYQIRLVQLQTKLTCSIGG